MSIVRFYYNATDPFRLSCELVAKAYNGQRKIYIRVNDTSAQHHIEQLLWQWDSNNFLPHVSLPSELQEQTPILISHRMQDHLLSANTILFNLADDPPSQASLFPLIIEIVSNDEQKRQIARQHWQQYQELGFEIRAYDAQSKQILTPSQ